MEQERTVRLHRVFPAPVERVYRAFVNADALAKWLPPYGFTATVHQLEPKVGGVQKISFNNLSTGQSHSFAGVYTELLENSLIRYDNSFDDPNLSGTMHVTIEFKPAVVGTEVYITQEGIPDAIPLAGCYLGWQQSLHLLALLVNPDIRDDG